MEKRVDPLRLILAYTNYDKKGLNPEMLYKIASELPIDEDENPYHFRKYFESIYR